MTDKADPIQSLEQAWSQELVFRRDCEAASQGAVKRKHLANLDSQGKGPEGRFLLMGKTAYPARNFFSWLRSKSRSL